LDTQDYRMHINHYMGKRLIREINASGGLLLIPADTVLDERHLRLIADHGCEITEQDVRAVSEFAAQQEQCESLIDSTTLKVQAYFDEIRFTQKIPIDDIRSDLLPHINQAAEHPHLFGLLSVLQAKDDYTYRHNLGVGVLSALLGKWLGLTDMKISELTMAATLHDVGKLKIPLEVLNKPGKLTADEYNLIKQHAHFGYEMLTETKGSTPIEAIVALQHHEREDGSGYPFGLKKDDIAYFSKIVAVADVYHAMSSTRSYHEPAPFYDILNRMMHNGFGEFDPRIVRVFIDRIMQMAVGNEVLLSDDRTGSIVLVHPSDPLRPLIKIGEIFVDLSQIPDLQIKQVMA
jgi:HD-GYP domain-containing protein (c-di-GMP phosphodiesterase class II)